MTTCYRIIGLLFLLTTPLFADFAWIPKEESLFFRGGWTYFHSTENYASDSVLEPITVYPGNYDISLSDHRFWIEPEYTFAPDLAGMLRVEFVSASATPISVGSGFGSTSIGDLAAGLKWRLNTDQFPVTIETRIKIPTYHMRGRAVDELSPGDGNADVLLKTHAGYRFNRMFVTGALGLNLRFGGYSSAFLFSLAAGGRYNEVYGAVFLDTSFSLSETFLLGSSLNTHTAKGSAGSYSRFSGSPSLVAAGLKLGVKASQTIGIEAKLERSLWGRRAPSYFQFGLNVLITSDFTPPPAQVRLKEVPFNEEN